MSPIRRSNAFATPANGPLKAAMLLALGALLGADAPPDADPAGTSRPMVLFNGKGLDGWKVTDFGEGGSVVVEDGAIVMHRADLMSGVTSTRDDLPRINYELTYEANRLEGADFFAAATFPVGDAYLTFVNGGWGGHVTGLSSIDGADASENDTGFTYRFANETWYRFRIRVTDAVVRGWIDETLAIDSDIRNRDLGTRIEVRASQPLGFATWQTTGAVRKVEVRQLTPEEVAATQPRDD